MAALQSGRQQLSALQTQQLQLLVSVAERAEVISALQIQHLQWLVPVAERAEVNSVQQIQQLHSHFSVRKQT